jgi:hypothetical protein
MIKRAVSVATILFLLTSTLGAAEVIPGRWEKVDLLASGSPIIIRTRYSEVIQCKYFDSNRETLLVVEASGAQRRIRRDEVENIVAEQYDDGLRNGMLIGMSAGVAGAILLATASKDALHRSRANIAVLGGVLFGLMGMGVGSLIDYEHKGRELIYQAPKVDK